MRIARVFVRDDRLRSGWRVTFYLICYVVGLLIVQLPLVGLYSVHLVLQNGITLSLLTEALQYLWKVFNPLRPGSVGNGS